MGVGHPTLDRVTETEFYAIIDAARPGTSPETPSADPDALYDVLSDRPDREVEAFAAEFRRQMVRLNRWSVWDAGYAASGGLSDDAFHYFRTWLIGKGAAAVELALTHPDELVPTSTPTSSRTRRSSTSPTTCSRSAASSSTRLAAPTSPTPSPPASSSTRTPQRSAIRGSLPGSTR